MARSTTGSFILALSQPPRVSRSCSVGNRVLPCACPQIADTSKNEVVAAVLEPTTYVDKSMAPAGGM